VIDDDVSGTDTIVGAALLRVVLSVLSTGSAEWKGS